MKTFDIQPVLGTAVREVANFLRRWHTERGETPSFPRFVPRDSLDIEACLRWLLIENPLTTEASQHGFCVRDALGVISGLSLNFPAAFLAGHERFLGLCSGSFFVEPQARTSGFYLFKRYLNSPGYSFYFATTCNAKASALWEKLGGSAVPGSEMEYILPLKLDVMLRAFLTSRTFSKVGVELARAFCRCANPALKLRARRSEKLTTEPCRDWEKLSELFRRHRSPDLITTDRSPSFLQWRYGPSSPNHSSEIFLFRDQRGNEGWFSVDNRIRGQQGEIRACALLDAIWPREKMNFRDILPAIVQRVSNADAFFFTPRGALDNRECSRWIIRRKLEAPRVWAMARKGGAPLAVSSLDLVIADGDGAWSSRYQHAPPSEAKENHQNLAQPETSKRLRSAVL